MDRRARILVVDDDQVILQNYYEILKKHGEVYLAETGNDAVTLAISTLPDIIFLDISLPDFNGFDVLKKLKERNFSSASVVMVTSHDTPRHFIESINVGSSFFLTKPVHSGVLEAVVKSVLLHSDERVKTDNKLKGAELKFSNVIGMISDAIIITDYNGLIKEVNPYCLNLFGYKYEELIGQNVKMLTPPGIREKHDRYIAEYNKTRIAHLIGNPRKLETITRSGAKLIIDLNLSEIIDNEKRYYLGVIRNITEKYEMEERLRKVALIDPLTNLRSRIALSLELDKFMNTEFHEGFVISAMLDIDDFQTLNTVLGHDVCDNVLKSIAEQLEEVEFQQNFCTYRVSADRFVVFKVESDETQAFAQKQLLMDQLDAATKAIYESHSFSVSITTVGYISKLNKLKQTPLVEQLELSLETVRLNGLKGQLVRASELDFQVASQSAALRLELAAGVKKDHLTIALQPKVNHANQISSFEALLRWRDERYSELHLGHYISAAEATGAIIEVGYFVIEQTCLFIKSLPKELRKPVYVNLSMRQLSDKNFIDRTLDLCHQHEVDNQLIGMELTESMVADDIELVRKELEQIVSAGFKISIDDFGTGQANLRYLSKLPLSQLKIDKSFIDDITNNVSKVPIVDSVYAIARSMNLTVVAEGVETAEQVKYVRDLGVEEIQGFFFFKPMPAEDCIKALESEHKGKTA